MIIAIREKENIYLAVSSSLQNIHEEDMVLLENSNLWKVKGRKGVYAGCENNNISTELLKHDNKLFAKEISYKTLLSHTLPRMEYLFDSFNILGKDSKWDNDVIIICDKNIFHIDRNLEIEEIFDWCCFSEIVWNSEYETLQGALLTAEKLPAKKRILEGVNCVDKATRINLFPITVLDIAKNKREVWWSYEDGLKKIKKSKR